MAIVDTLNIWYSEERPIGGQSGLRPAQSSPIVPNVTVHPSTVSTNFIIFIIIIIIIIIIIN